MINYYKTINNKTIQLDTYDDACWISIINPSNNEINKISSKFNIELNDLKAALDREERPRLEVEDNYNMILIDIPIDESDESIHYTTLPLGIFLIGNDILTISSVESNVINDFILNKVRNFDISKKTRFLLQIFKQNAMYYLNYLLKIDKRTTEIEKNIYDSVQNKELIQLLNLEKSLIYFSTSLKSNEITINKVIRSKNIKKYEDDEDFLEDVLIENKQALEMANIYGDVLSRVMDAFSSIISNNQNRVMSILTSITLSMSFVTILSGLFGMNVNGIPFSNSPNGFLIISTFSIFTCLIISLLTFAFSKKQFNLHKK